MRAFLLLVASVLASTGVGAGVEAATQPSLYGPPDGQLTAAFPSAPAAASKTPAHIVPTYTCATGGASAHLTVAETVDDRLVGASTSAARPTVGIAAATSRPSRAKMTAAPVKTVDTSDGVVGYRSVGRGAPIVLLTGKGFSIDSWPPDLVDQLATHHRVVLPDNAGVGRTSTTRGPLSIEAMANQIAAFIAALRLRRPAVLGWSMGGMVAQALASRHPDSISKVVLAATAPGNGRALGPSPMARRELEHERSGLRLLLQLLFSANQAAAARRYAASLRHYPHFYNASPVETDLQGSAVAAWMQGRDQPGRQDRSIHLPTLVADGAEDGLNPVGNDRMLRALIGGSQLVLYPDASHGFLFQDAHEFARRIDRFLAAPLHG